MKTREKRLPRGFRRGHSGDLACRHRDCSCCDECAAAHVEIVYVYGQHFWIPNEQERTELIADMIKAGPLHPPTEIP